MDVETIKKHKMKRLMKAVEKATNLNRKKFGTINDLIRLKKRLEEYETE